MKRSRFSEEQMIGTLKEQVAGGKVADLCRKRGMSDATLYNRKAKYGGLAIPNPGGPCSRNGARLFSPIPQTTPT